MQQMKLNNINSRNCEMLITVSVIYNVHGARKRALQILYLNVCYKTLSFTT